MDEEKILIKICNDDCGFFFYHRVWMRDFMKRAFDLSPFAFRRKKWGCRKSGDRDMDAKEI